ncbi:hypothetical protein GCM10010174_26940 [Kutzneria viridogrisea]|uniref:eCIS core domain-containing protein n=1 Tax=Kutzneria viridogrisea TaxID=47990 RepID=A0ABR6BVJ8_9PSEU|nr:hypothetical protein [Kutzneria viridogrisea]
MRHNTSSSGTPLPKPIRGPMERAFGVDFSGVRLHTGPAADAAAREIGALAFTSGRDIAFRSGVLRLGTPAGTRLIAHELTHVLQQGRGSGQDGSRVSHPDDPSEREAAATAEHVLAGETAQPVRESAGAGLVQRAGEDLCGGPRTCASTTCADPDPGHAGTGATATSWTLRVMIDIEAPSAEEVTVSTIGHTYVEFSDSTGRRFTYGFYPDGSSMPDPMFRPRVNGCVVHPDTAHERCTDYRESFALTKEEFEAALALAQLHCTARPKYDLRTFNCTTFARLIAEKAGKSLPPMRGKVGGSTGIVADNPNTLYEGLSRRDTGPTYRLDSDTELRTTIAATPAPELGRMPTSERIRVVNRLLDGWVSEGDMWAIEQVCASITSQAEMKALREAVGGRESALWSDGHKRRFHLAVNRL